MIKSLKCNFYMVHYLFSASKAIVFFRFLLAILKGLPRIIVNVLMPKLILDIFLSGRDLYKVFYVIGWSLLAVILIEGLSYYYTNIYVPIACNKVHIKMQLSLFDKAKAIDMLLFDDTDFCNRVLRTIPDAEDRMFQSLNILAEGLERIIQIALVAYIFFQIGWIYIVLIGIAVLFSLLLNPIIVKKNRKFHDESLTSDKKIGYYSGLFHSDKYAKDIRLFSGLYDVLSYHLHKAYKEKKSNIKKYEVPRVLLSLLQSSVSGVFISEYLVVLLLGYSIIVTQSASLSDFLPTYNGTNTLLASLFYLTGPFVQRLSSQLVYVEQFKRFLSQKPTITGGKLKPDGASEIAMENVSFSYSGNKNNVLNSLNITLQPGKKYAIVGENGAGKSTLIKLLLRLYGPASGSISLAKIPVEQYDLDQYRSMFSTVFQETLIVPTALGCNISMDECYDSDKANAALNKSGLDEISEKYELSHQVLKDFDSNGIILSGGQNQRLALSRAFYNDAEIIIMDEPSAALDPYAEYSLNMTLQRGGGGKTIIFVSHRLTTTKFADCIFYMSNGKIMEQGSHEQLLQKNGYYANMWNTQACDYLM